MKITITIVPSRGTGVEPFADEVSALLPTREQLVDYRRRVTDAVLPVKFRIAQSSTQSSFIEFDDE